MLHRDRNIFCTASPIIATCLDLEQAMMKFALTIVIPAVLLPCILAFDPGLQPEKDVLGKWQNEQMVWSQSSTETT